MRKEIFVCERCGERKRLDPRKQHWCGSCAGKKETEMQPARAKTFSAKPPERLNQRW